MRERFREWYAPTDQELSQLWQAGTVVLDSNVLLGLYQYPPATLDEFLKVLASLKGRLWLPHEAGLEYHRSRQKSLPQQRQILERLIKSTEEIAGHVDSIGLPEHHPVLDLAALEAACVTVKNSFDGLLQKLRDALVQTPEFKADAVLHGEPVRDRLTELFAGRVGAPFSADQLGQLYKEGADRYSRDVPPGYKDRGKEEPWRYADLVIWKQILDHGKASGEAYHGTLFVTNDRKDDWWLRKDDLLIGPRPELVREHLDVVGSDFFIYTPADFLKNAPQYLLVAVSPATIAEVRRLSTASPIGASLRAQRMILPDPPARVRAAARIYDELLAGRIQRVSDLNNAIESLGEPFSSNYVEVPLFWSLVNRRYGPLAAEGDVGAKLRERRVRLSDAVADKDAFIRCAHTAWLAQALYRLRQDSFADEDLLVAFFGDDYGDDAPVLLEQARHLARSDIAYRGDVG